MHAVGRDASLTPDTHRCRHESCGRGRSRHTVRGVAHARTSFLSDERVDRTEVRAPILQSWERAKDWLVPADRIDLPFTPGQSGDPRFLDAALPIVHEVADRLASEPVSVILCDAEGVVLERHAGDRTLHRLLDKVWLAPGFSYAEQAVGTNGIGTAVQERRPAQVFGHEHYAEDLTGLACVGYPVHHQATGALLGVVNLTTWRQNANSLLMTTAHNMARRIEQGVADQAGRQELALVRDYFAACAGSRSAVLALGDDLLMMNEQARTLLTPEDQLPLLAEAVEALSDGRRHIVVDLPSGSTARVHCRPGPAGDRGGILKVTLVEGRTRPAGTRLTASSGTCGAVGSGVLWTKCTTTVDRLVQGREWLILSGEAGTGKTTLAVAGHRRCVPTAPLRMWDAADHCRSWVDEIIDELDRRSGGTIVIRHLENLGESSAQALAEALERTRESMNSGHVRVIATITPRRSRPTGHLEPLYSALPHTVEVPPLRHRPEDVADLVPHLISRLAAGASLTVSPDALRLLMRNQWPGNVEQLRRVLTKVVAKRRTGTVTLHDLPPECRSSARRVLTPVEAIECDALVEALIDAGGDRARAAHSLGMSRATVYRKIRDYRIILPSARELATPGP